MGFKAETSRGHGRRAHGARHGGGHGGRRAGVVQQPEGHRGLSGRGSPLHRFPADPAGAGRFCAPLPGGVGADPRKVGRDRGESVHEPPGGLCRQRARRDQLFPGGYGKPLSGISPSEQPGNRRVVLCRKFPEDRCHHNRLCASGASDRRHVPSGSPQRRRGRENPAIVPVFSAAVLQDGGRILFRLLQRPAVLCGRKPSEQIIHGAAVSVSGASAGKAVERRAGQRRRRLGAV